MDLYKLGKFGKGLTCFHRTCSGRSRLGLKTRWKKHRTYACIVQYYSRLSRVTFEHLK